MLRRHNDLVGDKEGGVESHAELPDQIAEFGGAARLLRYRYRDTTLFEPGLRIRIHFIRIRIRIFCTLGVIFALLDPDPDFDLIAIAIPILTRLNPDPSRIRIRDPDSNILYT